MFIEKSLLEARQREDELRCALLFCLCDHACHIDGCHRGIEVEVQGRLVSGLAITKTSELFSVAEDEFDVEARFVKTKDGGGGEFR